MHSRHARHIKYIKLHMAKQGSSHKLCTACRGSVELLGHPFEYSAAQRELRDLQAAASAGISVRCRSLPWS